MELSSDDMPMRASHAPFEHIPAEKQQRIRSHPLMILCSTPVTAVLFAVCALLFLTPPPGLQPPLYRRYVSGTALHDIISWARQAAAGPPAKPAAVYELARSAEQAASHLDSVAGSFKFFWGSTPETGPDPVPEHFAQFAALQREMLAVHDRLAGIDANVTAAVRSAAAIVDETTALAEAAAIEATVRAETAAIRSADDFFNETITPADIPASVSATTTPAEPAAIRPAYAFINETDARAETVARQSRDAPDPPPPQPPADEETERRAVWTAVCRNEDRLHGVADSLAQDAALARPRSTLARVAGFLRPQLDARLREVHAAYHQAIDQHRADSAAWTASWRSRLRGADDLPARAVGWLLGGRRPPAPLDRAMLRWFEDLLARVEGFAAHLAAADAHLALASAELRRLEACASPLRRHGDEGAALALAAPCIAAEAAAAAVFAAPHEPIARARRRGAAWAEFADGLRGFDMLTFNALVEASLLSEGSEHISHAYEQTQR
ncbi:hypothetical protein NpPPO83_00008475 [Neofusicoccum parvum]|uniref:Uncharacterized protein n=1 Tax=Neofusicoccum parvum TaxID=310453 RepID=A0ACB5SAJ8_9PEZI|nr:hypothetical protein NpPPO83_00008475 [Neofusicoccum parvum]